MHRFAIVTFALFLLLVAVGCGGNKQSEVPGANVVISVSPLSLVLQTGGTQQLTATVTGTTDHRVTWSIAEGDAGGTISSTGSYTAPSNPGSFHVIATSMADPTKSASSYVSISAPPAATIPRLTAVWGSASNDVWSVGPGFIGHWDGKQWSFTNIQSVWGPVMINFEAVWGSGPNDVWAAGTSWALEFWHWDGTSWTPVPSTDQPGGYLVAYAWGIWGSGSQDVWAVGSTATSGVLHWDGTAWRFNYLVPASGQSSGMTAVWGSGPDDVWAVGGGDDTGSKLMAASVFHWDGTAWTQNLSGLPSELSGIWGSASNDVWVAGNNGLIAHWDGSSWTQYASGTTEYLTGVWGSGPSDVWAVGYGGTVLHWNGSTWLPVPSGTTQNLRDIWGSGPQDIWAVGDNVVLHLPL